MRVDGALPLVVGGKDQVEVAVVPVDVMAEEAHSGLDVAACLLDAHAPAEHRLADPVGSSGHELHDAHSAGMAHDTLLPAGLLPGNGERKGTRHAEVVRLTHEN